MQDEGLWKKREIKMEEKRDSIRYKSIIILVVLILVTSCSAGETKTLSIEKHPKVLEDLIEVIGVIEQ